MITKIAVELQKLFYREEWKGKLRGKFGERECAFFREANANFGHIPAAAVDQDAAPASL
jgi:hypothetical protein